MIGPLSLGEGPITSYLCRMVDTRQDYRQATVATVCFQLPLAFLLVIDFDKATAGTPQPKGSHSGSLPGRSLRHVERTIGENKPEYLTRHVSRIDLSR